MSPPTASEVILRRDRDPVSRHQRSRSQRTRANDGRPAGPSAVPKGRPSAYSESVEAIILNGLAEGRTLTSIVRIARSAGMKFPSAVTVRKWALNDVDGSVPGFSSRYARARDLMLEAMFDDIIDIADDDTGDVLWREVVIHGQVCLEPVPHPVNVQRARLRIDVRKWLLSKLRPERYGNGRRTKPSPSAGDPVQELLRQFAHT
jgi:hypothetical protein